MLPSPGVKEAVVFVLNEVLLLVMVPSEYHVLSLMYQ